MRAPAIVAVALLLALPAGAATEGGVAGDWSWEQGRAMRVATIETGNGSAVSVLCGRRAEAPAAWITVAISGRSPDEGETVQFSADGGPQIAAVARAGAVLAVSDGARSRFREIVTLMRIGETLTVRYPSGGLARFSLAGAAAAIGPCPAADRP